MRGDSKGKPSLKRGPIEIKYIHTFHSLTHSYRKKRARRSIRIHKSAAPYYKDAHTETDNIYNLGYLQVIIIINMYNSLCTIQIN